MRVVPYSEIYDDDPEREPGLFETATGIYDVEAEGSAPRPDPPRPDTQARLDALVQRAVGEQVAESRMMKSALTDVGERLRMLERSVSERLGELEGEVVGRLADFERSVNERMLAFETVLERLVDRLGAAETRIVEGLDHNDRMARAQLDALRPSLEAAFERVMDVVESAAATPAPLVSAAPVDSAAPSVTPEDVDAAVAKAMKAATTKLTKTIESAVERLAAVPDVVDDDELPEAPEPETGSPVVIDAEPVAPAKPAKAAKPGKRTRPLRAR